MDKILKDIIKIGIFSVIFLFCFYSYQTNFEIEKSRLFWEYITTIVIVVGVEVLIAHFIKIRHHKTILMVNTFTASLLEIFIIVIYKYIAFYDFLILFLIEILVTLSEYTIYVKRFKNIPHKKLVKYVMAANILSFLIAYVLFRLEYREIFSNFLK